MKFIYFIKLISNAFISWQINKKEKRIYKTFHNFTTV